MDIKRLKFVYTNSAFKNKDSFYLSALTSLEKKFIASPFSTDISYEIAEFYNQQGTKYEPLKSKEHKWDLKNALQVCNEAILRFPESDGTKNCRYLKTLLTQQNLSLTVEEVNVPNIPFRALLKYKNASKIYLRIVKTGADDNENGYRNPMNEEEKIKGFLKLSVIKDWSLSVEDDGDLQMHSTEIKIPELVPGKYVILVSSDQNFVT